jgi:hypothetical protein
MSDQAPPPPATAPPEPTTQQPMEPDAPPLTPGAVVSPGVTIPGPQVSGGPLGPLPQAPPPDVEIRDQLGAQLGTTALAMCQQVGMLSTGDPAQCKDMAQAVLYMTEALVLVAPLESDGATAGPGGMPVPLPPKHLPPQASLNTAEQQATGRAQ